VKNLSKPKKTLIAATVFFVLFLISLPSITKTALLYGLNHLGAEQSQIKDIDINLFTGRFSITGLQTQTNEQAPLYIGKLSATFPYWKLLDHHILIKNIVLENSQVPLIQKEKKPFYIGIFLENKEEKSANPATSPDAKKEKQLWHVSINKLVVADSAFQLETPDFSSTINIQALNLEHFSSQSSEQSQLSARAHLDNTQVKIGSDTFHLLTEKPIKWRSKQSIKLTEAPLPSVFIKGNLNLGEVSANSPTVKSTYKHDNLSLLISADINPGSANEALIQASIKSELSINKPYLSGQFINEPGAETLKAVGSLLELQIIQRLTLNNNVKPLHSSGTGRFNLQNAKLELKNNQLRYLHDDLGVQWSTKAQNLNKQHLKKNLKLHGGINLKQATIVDEQQKLGLLHLPQLAIQNIKLNGTDHLQIERIQLDQARGLYAPTEASVPHTPFVFSEALRIQNLELQPLNKLHIEQVQSTGLSTQLHLTKDKQLSLLEPTLTRLQALDFGSPETNNDKTVKDASHIPLKTAETEGVPHASTPSFFWQIDDIHLNKGAFTFSDASVSPSFTSTLLLDKLTLSPLGSAQDLDSQINLEGSLNSHSKIQALGSFTAFNPKPSSTVELSIQALELLPFSPYLDQSAGYRIKHGQLNSSIQVNIKNGELDSEAELNFNKLKLEPASEDARKRLNKQLTMPLDVALNTLRDKNKNIQLSIPVKGNISDPNFDFSDILKQASAKATRSASIGLLKHALQPYGTMITVAELAYKGGKKLTAIKLSPISYQAASASLEGEQIDYLEKIAILMKERPDIGITLCGVAIRGELPASKEDKTLLELAQDRAESVKGHLIHNFKIDATRLYSCLPRIDEPSENKRVGRVELNL
jgi:hypothetical protein